MAVRFYLVFFLTAQMATAWGPVGHRLVARIAARYLDERTQKLLLGIFSGDSDAACAAAVKLEDKMACVSSWADEVRRARPESGNWHFTDIPVQAENYEESRDCRWTPKGDCAILAAGRFRDILGNASAPAVQRAEALKFLIHIMGDIHQPLHDGDDQDAGGNGKRVTWFGEKVNTGYFNYDWNLHSVWDVAILARMGKDEETLLKELLAPLPGFQFPLSFELAKVQQGSIVSWSLEGHRIARDHIYGNLPAPDMGDATTLPRYALADGYQKASEPVVMEQLRRGGIRLARVLREALRMVSLPPAP